MDSHKLDDDLIKTASTAYHHFCLLFHTGLCIDSAFTLYHPTTSSAQPMGAPLKDGTCNLLLKQHWTAFHLWLDLGLDLGLELFFLFFLLYAREKGALGANI